MTGEKKPIVWVLKLNRGCVLLYGERNMDAIEPLPCNASYWMVLE